MDAETKREEEELPKRRKARHRRREESEEGDLDLNAAASSLLREWLSDNPPKGLSSAQLVKHLALQLMAVEGPLKEYLLWSLQSPSRREGRMQNLFPLPLWYDGREALNEILDEMKVKDESGDWRKRGDTKGRASKALRGQGLRAWHGLVVVMLNFMYGDRAVGTRPTPSGQATAPQERALETLWELVRVFIDEKEANGVPRTSMEDWDVAIDSLRVSYTGEVIEKAVPLTLNQVLPGLPSPEHGGLVDILAVLPEEPQETVKHPEKLVLSPSTRVTTASKSSCIKCRVEQDSQSPLRERFG